jgi:hypothetical protein
LAVVRGPWFADRPWDGSNLIDKKRRTIHHGQLTTDN